VRFILVSLGRMREAEQGVERVLQEDPLNALCRTAWAATAGIRQIAEAKLYFAMLCSSTRISGSLNHGWASLV